MLRTRLILGLAPLVVLLVAMGLYAIGSTERLSASLQQDLVRSYESIYATQRMRSAAQAMNAAVAARTRDPLAASRDFAEHRGRFDRELMEQSARAAGTPRATVVVALDDAFTAMVARAERLLAGPGAGSLDALREDEAAWFRVTRALDALNRFDVHAAGETAAQAKATADRTRSVLLGASAGAVLLAILIAWRLAAAILRPIKSVTASAVAVGEGDWDRAVPVLSRDELGQLATAFNQMATKLRAFRESTQERVVQARRTMEATLTSTPDPVFVVARDGEHTVRNPAAEELAALPEFSAGFPAPLADALRRVIESGEHYLPTDYGQVVTVRVRSEDHHYLPRILAIGDSLTEFKGAAVVLQDVTRFRLLDDAKTNLVGTVSHELKTPLTSLRMAVYLLLEQNVGRLEPQQRELLEGARDDADRLLRILDTLLDLARLESGAAALQRRDVRVGTLLDEIAAEAAVFLTATSHPLDINVSPAVREMPLNVDPDRLRHVFINLLTNAAKYSPDNSAIALSATDEPDAVRFAVRDQGPGLESDVAARVFDRFFRAPGQTKTGAGLGLTIAREIVVAHGGTIGCVSEPGRGAEFFFTVPRSGVVQLANPAPQLAHSARANRE